MVSRVSITRAQWWHWHWLLATAATPATCEPDKGAKCRRNNNNDQMQTSDVSGLWQPECWPLCRVSGLGCAQNLEFSQYCHYIFEGIINIGDMNVVWHSRGEEVWSLDTSHTQLRITDWKWAGAFSLFSMLLNFTVAELTRIWRQALGKQKNEPEPC